MVGVLDKVFDIMEDKNKENGAKDKLEAQIFKLALRTFSTVSINTFMGYDSFNDYI